MFEIKTIDMTTFYPIHMGLICKDCGHGKNIEIHSYVEKEMDEPPYKSLLVVCSIHTPEEPLVFTGQFPPLEDK